MPHPQDVAVPSERHIVLPEPFQYIGDGTANDDVPVFTEEQVRAAIIADRATGHASAEPEGAREALRNLLVMLPSDHEDRPSTERIPVSYCYVRWIDIREARAALAAAPTPTASVAPKAEASEHERGYNAAVRDCAALGWKSPKAEGEAAAVRSLLQDPVAVHVAMLRGEIAKPAIRDMLHVYGADALAQFDRGAAPVAQAAAGATVAVSGLLAEKVQAYQTRDGLRFTVDGGLSWFTTWRANGLPNGPIEIRLSPRPEADADRVSGGGADTERLDWLQQTKRAPLNCYNMKDGFEGFTFEASSRGEKHLSLRAAIDAARATPTTKD